MRTRSIWSTLALLAVLVSRSAWAADHSDGTPAVLEVPDPSSDITDVFVWMADANHVNLVMDVFPSAVVGSKFSNSVQYVFHATAKPSLLTPTGTTTHVICTFNTSQTIRCWVVAANNTVLDYVTGDVGVPSGITSVDGKMRVFAGLRDDPFFFNLAGFRNATKMVAGAIKAGVAPTLAIVSLNADGCPTLSFGAQTAVVTQLKSNAADNGPGVDFFAKGTAGSADQPLSGNILSIVVVVDKSLLSTPSASVVGVWGSTNKAQ